VIDHEAISLEPQFCTCITTRPPAQEGTAARFPKLAFSNDIAGLDALGDAWQNRETRTLPAENFQTCQAGPKTGHAQKPRSETWCRRSCFTAAL